MTRALPGPATHLLKNRAEVGFFPVRIRTYCRQADCIHECCWEFGGHKGRSEEQGLEGRSWENGRRYGRMGWGRASDCFPKIRTTTTGSCVFPEGWEGWLPSNGKPRGGAWAGRQVSVSFPGSGSRAGRCSQMLSRRPSWVLHGGGGLPKFLWVSRWNQPVRFGGE